MATEKKLQGEKLEKWRDVIAKMDLKELLKLQFCNDDSKKWQLMYTPYSSGGKSFYCNICKMVLIDQNSVKSHSGYNKHNKSLEKVFDLFHESIDPFEEKSGTKAGSNTAKNNTNSNNEKESMEKSKEFKDKMQTFNMQEFLEVEYLMKDKWEKLFIAVKGGHSCTICKSNLLTSLTGLKNHITNRQHKANIDLVKILYHPKHLNFTKGSSNDIVDLANSDEKGDDSDDDDFLGKHIIKNLVNMTISELLRVEFKQEHSSPWKVLFQSLNARNDQFKCIVCNSPNLKSLNELNNHLKDEKHLNKLKSVHALFHSNALSNTNSQKITESKKEMEKEKSSSTLTSNNSEKKSSTPASNNSEKNSSATTQNSKTSEIKSTASTTPSTLNSSDKKSTTSTNVSASPGTKYKSVADFASDITSMEVKDVLKIEFLTSNNIWKKLIRTESFGTNFATEFYACEICDVKKLKDIPLMDHLKGKRHKDGVRLKVTRFHHPVLLPTKTEKDTPQSKPTNEKDKTQANLTKETNIETSHNKKATNENLVKIVPQAKTTVQNNASKVADEKKEVVEIVTVEDSPERELFDSKANEKKSVNPGTNVTVKTTSSKENQITKTSDSNKQTFEKKEFSTNLNEELDGFVGVEYVIKLIKHATDNDPRFECCLCEIELNANGMQFHLKGVAHRTKYLERHFSTCMKQFKDFRGDYKVMHQVTDKICKAIEKYHGRDLPMELVLSDFKANRRSYVEKVFSFRHASEMSGPSFTNVVDKNELNNIKNNKNFKIPERNLESKVTFTVRDNKRKANYPYSQDTSDKKLETRGQEIPKAQSNRENFNKIRAPFREETNVIPNYPSNFNPSYGLMNQNNMMPYERPVMPGYQDPYNAAPYYENQTRPERTERTDYPVPVLDNEEHRRLAEKFIKQTKVNDRNDRHHRRSRSPRRHSHRRSSRSRSRSRSKKDDRQRRDHSRRSLSKSPLREDDVWQAYRRKFDMDIKIVDMDFQQYYKDPTSYPTYNEEWQNFWANRMNEIKKAGRDHTQHDFTYEWSLYFPKRLEELYEKEVEALKIRLRERFYLPMHDRDLKQTKYQKYHLKGLLKVPEADIDDTSKSHERHISPEKRKELEKKRSPSPTSYSRKRKSTSVEKNLYQDKKVEDTNSKKRKMFESISRSVSPEKILVEEKTSPTAISVLRVLTALEDNLGLSLGPKIIDLMSKALILEKTRPNAVDENLLTIENCILLETCREKLKGQILAGILKDQQLRAVTKVIEDITEIVNKANEYRSKNIKPIELSEILKKASNSALGIGSSLGSGSQQPKFSSAPRPPGKNIMAKAASNTNARQSNQGNSSSANENRQQTATNTPSMSQNQKKELAKKLAQALAAQGKTDISTEHCEKLIEVYTLIDKKKQESENLNSQEKSLSECLQDCIKSGSLVGLTSLIQDKNKAAAQNQPQGNYQMQQQQLNMQMQQFNQQNMNNQPRYGSNNTMSSNQFGNFSHLANFDTSLSVGNSSLSLNRNMGPSNTGMQGQGGLNNLPSGNWVQGSVLSGRGNPNNVHPSQMGGNPNMQNSNIPQMGGNQYNNPRSFGNSSNPEFNQMQANFNQNNMPGGNWQSNYNSTNNGMYNLQARFNQR